MLLGSGFLALCLAVGSGGYAVASSPDDRTGRDARTSLVGDHPDHQGRGAADAGHR